MTLDDIRARDAADIPITLDMTGADWRRALWQVAADRRTLLGMLEPSAVPEHEPCCACCSEVGRHPTVDDVSDFFYAGGVEYERARIAAEVLAEPTLELATGVYVDLASVLEDIAGADR